ncbi:MAG: ROK family protein [Betaproteobacteria bacterium]|nr:ROK family protein [Betaproteobacteria bacterium]
MTGKQYISQWHDARNEMGTRTLNVVAGDIGGTKSWLVWFVQSWQQPKKILFEQQYDSAQFASINALLIRFFSDAGRESPPDSLYLALPGPVDARQVRLTNLAWLVDADVLSRELGIADVRFVNDFQAAARGVETLNKSDVYVLNAGVPKLGGTRVITGAGTGLGVAWMQADSTGKYAVYASEGGHMDFAPANAEQCQMRAWFEQRHGHVSWERLLSGSGLSALYEYLGLQAGQSVLSGVDAARVHALALQNEPLAQAAIQLFTDIYAAWAGNLAMLYQPRGGLYLAGGVSIHLQDWLKRERFMLVAAEKGRMAGLVSQMPIYLITNFRLGLQGAMCLM